MTAAFASGHVVDALLLLMAGEAAVIGTRWARHGRADAVPALLCNLAAGAWMLLALRVALTGGSWVWIALALAASGAAHAADLRSRNITPSSQARP